MRLLCLSNGHGEDQIALQVLKSLRQLPNAPTIEVLPIVGEGHAYRKQGFSIIGTVKAMPSGGFIYMDGKQLAQDIQGGLLKLTLQQLKTVRQWAKAEPGKQSMILAVGDIVPLLFAWQSGIPYAFIGTAKSEYYLRDEQNWHQRDSWWDDRFARITGSVYYPWERWFLSRPNCQACFPRDHITAQQLQKFGLPAYDFGNPMMDLDLPGTKPESPEQLQILLLPGSRAPEAYRNWETILAGVQSLVTQPEMQPFHFFAALSPGLDRTILQTALNSLNWQISNPGASIDHNSIHYQHNPSSHQLTLGFGKFAEYAEQADLAIAMAGTATEQFVGLGKPAITIPGEGPQFTAAFAEAQTRLLGCSILLIKHPHQVAQTVQSLYQNPEQLKTIARNGKQRMGDSGSSDRIATKLTQLLTSQLRNL